MSAVLGEQRERALPWHWRRLLAAPHRIAFFLATVVLVAAGVWWAAVQLDRAGAGFGLRYALSPSIVHAAAMTLGFMPLYFAGFLFTAGPRWLGVEAPSARQVLPALATQAAGWLVWIAGAHVSSTVALAGLAVAALGFTANTLRFWGLVRRSEEDDRLHAKTIAFALSAGCVCLAGLLAALVAQQDELARRYVLTGLWACVVVVYVTVAHRMIPFFTSSALPMQHAWRPNWALALMLGLAGFEAASVWLRDAWLLPRAAVEIAGGTALLWLAFAWGLVQSLKIRLLAMLHLGFLWLGLGLMIAGFTHVVDAVSETPVLPLAALHAVTIGALGSLMLAMVTRVTCGHSGRPLVADNLVWTLFWLLQGAALLRIAATLPGVPATPLLATAALTWAGVVLIWGMRNASWWGRPRADGRPG